MSFDLQSLPESLNGYLGCGVEVSGLILSLVFISLVMLPIIGLTKGRQFTLYILVGVVASSPFVALGWLPIWIYIIIVLFVALKFGQQLAGFMGGARDKE